MRIPRLLHQQHIIGGTLVLSLTQFLASLVGLLRDRVLAQTFPDLRVVDVYIASFRPSDFLFQTCIVSALGTVLVPVLASHAAHERHGDVGKLLSGTMALGAMVFGVIALIMAIALPWIAPYLSSFEGEQLRLYVNFARLALLSNFLFVFGNTLGQYLITVQRYWVYGITPILYTLGTIGGTLLFTPRLGAYGPIVGTLCGTGVYVLLRLIAVLHHGAMLKPTLWHPDFPQMGMLMLPRILSLGAMQLQLLVFDAFASGLPAGGVTINAYARNFQSVLVGVTGIALAQSAYAMLGKSAAWRNAALFRKYMTWGIGTLLLITIPGAIALTLLAPFAARLVGITQLTLFSGVLALYAISVPFESLNHLLLRAFYATKQTLIPALAACANAAVAVTTVTVLIASTGASSLGLAFTLGQVTQALVLGVLLASTMRSIGGTSAKNIE